MRFLLLLLTCWLVVFLGTRAVLLGSHLTEAGGASAGIFAIGALYDLGFLAYAAFPLGMV